MGAGDWLLMSSLSRFAVAVLTAIGLFFAGMVVQALAEKRAMDELRARWTADRDE